MPARDIAVAATGTAAAVVRFTKHLRAAGLTVDLGAILGFVHALSLIDLAAVEDVRETGAALFVRGPEERPVYDAVFNRYWRGPPVDDHRASTDDGRSARDDGRRPDDDADEGTGTSELGGEPVSGNEEPMADDDGPSLDDSMASPLLAYSARERLRTKSFDAMTPEEVRDAAALVDLLNPRLARRRTRRFRNARHGRLLAPRSMMRRSLQTGGDPVGWVWRRRRVRPRPIVAICDISGSMEQVSRFALRFLHALGRADVRTEAFVFGTRLTRITPHLAHRDADRALRDVSVAVSDWGGGTQIGAALRAFNRRWARRVLRSSSIVVVVSDGWDRGDASVVREEMARLARRCHRIIWLNPLASTLGYEPRTAGMAAAYPYIDDFLPISDLASLERLAEQLVAIPHDRHRSRIGRS